MSREKQIGAICKDLNEIFDKEYGERRLITAHHTAKALYDAGYRKQSEGEWIWTENGEADCEKYWICSVCKEHEFVRTKYCPNCGAKMKGGAE